MRVFPTFFSSSCEMCVFSLDISQKKEKRERKQKKKVLGMRGRYGEVEN